MRRLGGEQGRPGAPTRRRIAAGSAAAALALSLLASCSFEITASRYALVYGAADYLGTEKDLGTTDDDARDMAAALSAAGWTVVQTRQPTVNKQDILDDIVALAPVVDADSSVVVFFSGHGTQYNGQAYFLPTDSIDAGGHLVESNAVSPAVLLAALDELLCRNRVLILDTCYSGGFVTADDTGTVDSAPQNYGKNDDGTAALPFFAALGSYGSLLAAAFNSYDPATPIVVSAAGSEEPSYEWNTTVVDPPNAFNSTGNGIFTYFFLQAASAGDADGNGFVTIQEAYRYAENCVKKYWNDYVWNDPNHYDSYSNTWGDYLPRISGNARDIVIF